MHSHYKNEQLLDAIQGVVRPPLTGVKVGAAEFWVLTASPGGGVRGLMTCREELCQVLPIKLRIGLQSLSEQCWHSTNAFFPERDCRFLSKLNQNPLKKKAQPSN